MPFILSLHFETSSCASSPCKAPQSPLCRSCQELTQYRLKTVHFSQRKTPQSQTCGLAPTASRAGAFSRAYLRPPGKGSVGRLASSPQKVPFPCMQTGRAAERLSAQGKPTGIPNTVGRSVQIHPAEPGNSRWFITNVQEGGGKRKIPTTSTPFPSLSLKFPFRRAQKTNMLYKQRCKRMSLRAIILSSFLPK